MIDQGALEGEFQQTLLSQCEESIGLSFKHSRFRQLVAEFGAVEATKQIVRSSNSPDQTLRISSGLGELQQLGRFDLSIHALVVDSRWRGLFTDEERAIARYQIEESKALTAIE